MQHSTITFVIYQNDPLNPFVSVRNKIYMKSLKTKLTIVLLYLSFNVKAQQVQAKLDSLFNALEKAHAFNGNILIAEQGKLLYKRSVGYADITSQIPNTDLSRFQIGSVSKTFTSVAVAQLYERGKLGLNDPLIKYIPEFPYPGITIYQLLSHTSGLPDKEELFMPVIDKDPERQFTNADIIPMLKTLNKQPAFVPGSEWRYCNIAYSLLAILVEKVSGKSFGDYLATNIFRPAGMKHSSLLSATKEKDQVSGYLVRAHYSGDLEKIEDSKKVRPWTYNMRGLVGPTNIVSTTSDLLSYDEALRSGKLLKPSTLKTMLSPAKLNDGSTVKADGEFGKASYALGWFVQADKANSMTVMHTGREPGFFSFFARDLKNNRTIIIIDNTEGQEFGTACKEVLNILSGQIIYPKLVRKKSLFLPYAKLLLEHGPDKAITFFNANKDDTANYFMDERELNELGLELLSDGHLSAALESLKLCTLLYPNSWNTYDSYGKALLAAGMKEQAIAMYRKSVDMFPDNLPGKKILDALSR